jgi:multiple sugar transport system substrate-binding protein
MSRTKSKLHVTLVLSTAFLLAFLGWKPESAAAKDQVTLQWLEWWDGEWGTATMDALMKRFEDKTGIKVERTAVPWDSMYDLMIADAQGGGKYDVYGMEGCCFLTGIDKLGGLEPLGPYLQHDKDFADSLTAMTVVKWRGEPMMLNWYIMPYSYVYNIDILKKADLQPPRNWSEAVEVSKKLNDSHLVSHGLGITFGDSSLLYPVYYLFGSRLAQLGGRLYDDQGHAVFNSKEGVAAMNWYKDLYQSGVLGSDVFGETWTQLREDFATQKVAAFIGGPFEGTIARQVNPNIHAAYPQAWCDKTCGYQWAGSGLAMSAKSTHKAEAWEFIRFLLSDENTVALTKQLSIPFGTKAAIGSLTNSQDPILSKIPQMLNGDPDHNIFLAPTPDFERLHRTFLEAFQQVLSGKRDTQEALNSVVAVWNQAIEAAKKQ